MTNPYFTGSPDERAESARAFRAERNSLVPGDHSMRLTADWEGLDKGTVVQPISAGYDRNRHVRTVNVISGPRAGETVTGAF